jgi:hypothetical protein
VLLASGSETNTLPFAIAGTLPTVTSVAPTSGQKGLTASLTITGTAFDPTTAVANMTDAAGAAHLITKTGVTTSTSFTGTIDLTPLAVGNYGITVQNNGAYTSNAVGFIVLSNDPSLLSVSPASAKNDATAVALTLTGSGFQSGATVTLTEGTTVNVLAAPVTVTVTNATTINVSGLNLTTYALGTWTVTVTNPGSKPSAGVAFTINPGTPILTSMNPNTASQGATQPSTSTLTGTYFYPTSVVHVASGTVAVGSCPVPSAAVSDTPLITTYSSPTSLSATADLSQVQQGTYNLWVVNPGSPPLTSAQVTFCVGP